MTVVVTGAGCFLSTICDSLEHCKKVLVCPGTSNLVLSLGWNLLGLNLSTCFPPQVKAEIIATFSLCGFANLTSIGITLGGLSELFNSPRSSTCQADPALAHCKAEAR